MIMVMMMSLVEVMALVYCTIFLLYGCYTDLKTRRVPNRVWIYMLPGAVAFFLFRLSSNFPEHLIVTLVLVAVVYLLAEIIFYISQTILKFRLMGGADIKALMMITFLFPTFHEFTVAGQVFPLLGLPPVPIFVLTVFNNAVILNGIIFPILFIRNILHSGVREFLHHPHYFFLGYKTDIQSLKHKRHVKLLEYYTEDESGVKPVFSKNGIEITEKLQSNLLRLSKKGLIENEIWVTPVLPFFIPITLGLLTAALIGDILFWTVQHVMT